ncbi:Cna B-type domain-containing protein, partial [Mammaliicoccus stepanovicii]
MGKKLVVFSVFMLLLNLFSPFVNGEKVFAEGQDISARNVTNLTVNPEVMNDGANAKVRVTFDDTGGKIKSGDFIKVDWPSNNQGKIEGFSKTIPLEIRGKKVGEVVINKDGATITFSDNIETFDDASGFAEFEIQGRNYTDTQQEDDKNVTIKSGNTSKVVTIHKGESGTESVFYDKTGDILPEDTSHVRWFLNINNEQKPVSKEIRVNDQIQEGQQLELESLNIRIDGTHSNYFSGPDAIAKFQEYIPGAVITADQDKNTIDVYIPQGYASNNQFTIAYKTKITNEKQKEFINRSQAWYQEHGKEEVNGKSFDYTVQNISGDAGIEGTEKGELKIFKKDKDTKSPISNVKFKLTRADGNVIINNQQEVEIITNNEGIANIKGLPSGKYIVKETEAPAPYQFDKDKTYEFELKDEDNVGYFLEVDNEKKEIKTKDVTAKKVWEDGKTNHPTIFFKLYQKSSDGSVVPVENAEIKKLESGITEVTWENVLESDQEGNKIEYVAQEVNEQGESTVPKGYTKKEEGLTITNTEKELEKTKIAVEKIWDDKNNQDGKRAKEVQVQLYKIVDNKKESVGEVVSLSSENNWSYEWQNLDKLDSNDNVIDYKVEEINTTGGYESSISKVNDNSFAITNTYKPESTKVSGEKVWKDHDNQDGKRPEKVTVNLLANGEKIDSVEVSEQDG